MRRTCSASTLDETWYDEVIDEMYAYVRCDCGFFEVDAFLSGFVKPGVRATGDTGTLLSTMDIIVQKVISVVRRRGIQPGTIIAYVYEY